MADQSQRLEGVSILMPVYNLAGSIAASIDRVRAATQDIAGVEIIVADDGSTDASLANAKAAAAGLDSVTVVGHSPNRGKGAALRTAFAASTRDTVVFLDGDLDLPPEQVPHFLHRFQASGADVQVGTKRGAMAPERYPPLRRILSQVFSAVIRLLFRLPVGETQTGLKAFRRGALAETLPILRVERYSYDLELLVALHRRGYSITEAPVQLAEGASGSGVSFRTLWEMGRDTFRIWLRTVLQRI